jgi:hypothetical protein
MIRFYPLNKNDKAKTRENKALANKNIQNKKQKNINHNRERKIERSSLKLLFTFRYILIQQKLPD